MLVGMAAWMESASVAVLHRGADSLRGGATALEEEVVEVVAPVFVALVEQEQWRCCQAHLLTAASLAWSPLYHHTPLAVAVCAYALRIRRADDMGWIHAIASGNWSLFFAVI